MNNSLEQETEEEFETKYNLIFENPVRTDETAEKPLNQILDSNSEDEQNVEDNVEDSLGENTENNIIDEERVEECTALVTVKERRLMAAQTMFKKSIKISLKSFLISLSLSFLNLFI